MTEYRWEGRVIRLLEKDYDQWKRSFPHIELDGCLVAKDAELSDGTDAERKKWFANTAMWLMAMNNTQRRLRETDDRKQAWFSDPHRSDPFAPQYEHLKKERKH